MSDTIDKKDLYDLIEVITTMDKVKRGILLQFITCLSITYDVASLNNSNKKGA